jgi:hypothetical protein
VLLCNHEPHENWIDVLEQGHLFWENYRWSNEYALLKWYESDGNGNSINFGHYVGNDYTNEYYIAFKIEDGDTPQLAWLKLRGNQFIQYGFQYIKSGVENHSQLRYFRVYPNPATDNIYFKASGQDLVKSEVSVYNMLGQKMDSFTMDSDTYDYSVQHLPKGMYIMVVTKENQQLETHKILVE